MRINADDIIAKDILVLNTDTGEFIELVSEACDLDDPNITTPYNGWYRQYQKAYNGNLKKCYACDELIQKFILANIKLVYSPLNER